MDDMQDQLNIENSAPQKYTLEDLLAKVTPENIHAVVDFGSPVGKEVW